MRKGCTFLCGIVAAMMVTGCGAVVPDLTQEETDLISEYAVGVLLKYDKNHGSRLVDTSEYEEASPEEEQAGPEEEQTPEAEQEPETEVPADDTEVVDVSQDEEIEAVPATIEEYYGIPDFTFLYGGYELAQSYPSGTEGEDLFFTMDATLGTQLLVLKFTAANTGASDQTLNMLGYGARFRVSVNGEASKGALATMLLNDMQTFDSVVPAGGSVELVSIIEVPESINIDTIDFVLRGNEQNAIMKLQ